MGENKTTVFKIINEARQMLLEIKNNHSVIEKQTDLINAMAEVSIPREFTMEEFKDEFLRLDNYVTMLGNAVEFYTEFFIQIFRDVLYEHHTNGEQIDNENEPIDDISFLQKEDKEILENV